MTSWLTYPRRADRLILVGQNPRTRAAIPWDDPNAEIWTLNEAPVNDWLKRYDRLFQIHPRWDWERENNFADPNHPLFLKAISGECLFCHGAGHATRKDGTPAECPYCKGGQYAPPDHRAGRLIYMQESFPDVPGAVALPLDEMTERFCADAVPYFTSTFAFMLVFAAGMLEFPEIVCYGFGMESDTEYRDQRPCADYWGGYFRGRGVKISAPGSPLFSGPLYAFESPLQGLRTRYDLRLRHLAGQLQNAERAAFLAEGALQAVTPFRNQAEVTPAFMQWEIDHFRKKSFVSFLRGAIKETENAIRMIDAYDADASTRSGNMRAIMELEYELG